MVSELDLQTIITEFDSYMVHHIFGFNLCK